MTTPDFGGGEALAKLASRGSLTGWRSLAGRLWSAPDAVIGAAILVTHLVVAVAGQVTTPYPYTEFHMLALLQPPSASHWFGTDQFGRDILSRVMYGGGGTLLLSVLATVFGVGIGVAVGMTVGYLGGVLDEVVMRIMDGLLSFPSLLLAMMIVATLGPSSVNVIVAIVIVFAPRATRVVRSVTLSLRELEFVEAAKIRGESAFYVITRELLPNALGPIVVEVAIRFSFAILLSTSLGFIGIGVQPPTPDWGLMVSEGRAYLQTAPWMTIFPALAISTVVIGANLFADGVGSLIAYRGRRGDL